LRKGRAKYAKTFATRCKRDCIITFGKRTGTKPEAFIKVISKGQPLEKGFAKKTHGKGGRQHGFTFEKGKWKTIASLHSKVRTSTPSSQAKRAVRTGCGKGSKIRVQQIDFELICKLI